MLRAWLFWSLYNGNPRGWMLPREVEMVIDWTDWTVCKNNCVKALLDWFYQSQGLDVALYKNLSFQEWIEGFCFVRYTCPVHMSGTHVRYTCPVHRVVSRRETVISCSDVSDWFKREQVVYVIYNDTDNWYLHICVRCENVVFEKMDFVWILLDQPRFKLDQSRFHFGNVRHLLTVENLISWSLVLFC